VLKRFFNNYAPSKTVASSTDVVGFKKNRQSGGMMGRGLIMLNRTLTLMLAFAAGSLGGTLLRNVVPTGTFAQTQSTAPKEIRAQRFTLVDENGRMRGVFAIKTPFIAKWSEAEGWW